MSFFHHHNTQHAMNAQEMYEQAMRELAAKISLIRSGDLACDHPIKQGDNYGTSCSICGERLAGYGYNARDFSLPCLHEWWPTGDGLHEVCTFCESVRYRSD